VYSIEVGSNGEVGHQVLSLAKGYTQIYGLFYSHTFLLATKMTIVLLFFIVAALHHWSLYQLDIEIFSSMAMWRRTSTWLFCCSVGVWLVCKLKWYLNGLIQSQHVWFEKFSHICQIFGLKHSEAYNLVFYYHTPPRKVLI